MTSARLHLGDGRAGLLSLPNGSVDHAITDPPFDKRTHRAAACARRRGRAGDRRVDQALPFSPLETSQLEAWAAELARVVRRWILIFAAERQIEPWAAALEAAGARFVRLGVVVRTNPRPQQTRDRPAPAADHLVIAHAGTSGPLRWNGGGRPARWEARAARWDTGGKQLHPAQKPLPLMEALIDDFTERGELVVDPFAGVATTGVACARMGRGFCGWELEARWHALGLNRLRAAREQLPLDLEADPADEGARPRSDMQLDLGLSAEAEGRT